MEIRCKKENCEYNTGCSCKAGSIAVDRVHHCASYTCSPLKDELTEQHGNIFEVTEKKAKSHLRNVPLACSAKTCLFNKDEHCQANGITVLDDTDADSKPASADCADCATFCDN